MNTKNMALVAVLVALTAGGYFWLAPSIQQQAQLNAVSPAEGKEEGHVEEGEHGEAKTTTIAPDAAKAAAIEVETAGPTTIRESLPLTGKIILNPDAEAQIKARFAGVVKRLEKAVGDNVRKGDVLAYVESNDSLQTYPVTSPLAGTVLTRSINVGDTAADEAIFVVADLDRLMAEFHVFPRDLDRMRVGQVVRVQNMDGSVADDGSVKSLLPTTDVDTQTVRALVEMTGTGGQWRPGMAVQGGAVVSQQEVALGVKNSAFQTMDGKTVLFVQEGDTYETREVKLGKSDGVQTEVLAGVKAGEKYVARNSFVVKADVEKSGAGHDH
jgi:cobalt-zinc-cadmium efflux system membrane fusion protein